MRKFFLNFMTVVLATSLVMVSCDEKQNVDDPNKDQNQTENPDNGGNTTPTTPTVDYAAQGYTVFNGSDLIIAQIPQTGVAQIMWGNETDSLIVVLGIGESETLPLGEYTMEDTEDFSEFTWQYGYCFYIDLENEIGDYLTDGTIEVSKKGRQYVVLTKCVNSDGDSIKYAYVGALDLELPGFPDDPYFGEEETEDKEIVFTQPYSWFVGDVLKTGNGLYQLNLLYETNETWSQAVLYLVGDNTSTATALTTGTYTVSNGWTGDAKTILPGFFDAETANESSDINDGLVPSFIVTDAGYYLYYITGGSFEVSNNDGVYTINGTLISALGTNIAISYTGVISITDESKSNGASAKVVKANNVKKLKLNRRALRVRK